MMYAAPGTATQIGSEDVVRGEGEADAAYVRRQNLLIDLWAIPTEVE
jgi:hypothetical protein